MRPRREPFVQLDLFNDSNKSPKSAEADISDMSALSDIITPEPVPTPAPAPKPVAPVLPKEPWTAANALFLLNPDTAELLILSLGLRQRRPHRNDEIAMVLSRPRSWVEQGLRQAYQTLNHHFRQGEFDASDAELAKIRARLSQVAKA